MDDIRQRLEYLRSALRSQDISYGELAELQGLASHIEPGDVELLEAAGIPEHPECEAEVAMQEFLVHFKITMPPGGDRAEFAHLYEMEAEAAEPLIKSGHFRRVWREAGTRNHWALWAAPDANFVHECYSSFPLWQAGYAVAEVIPLAVNENDPGWPGPGPTEVKVESGEPTMHLGEKRLSPLEQTLNERERQLHRDGWPAGTS